MEQYFILPEMIELLIGILKYGASHNRGCKLGCYLFAPVTKTTFFILVKPKPVALQENWGEKVARLVQELVSSSAES